MLGLSAAASARVRGVPTCCAKSESGATRAASTNAPALKTPPMNWRRLTFSMRLMPAPQPKRVPVSRRSSRRYHNSGISGSPSYDRSVPLTLKVGMEDVLVESELSHTFCAEITEVREGTVFTGGTETRRNGGER